LFLKKRPKLVLFSKPPQVVAIENHHGIGHYSGTVILFVRTPAGGETGPSRYGVTEREAVSRYDAPVQKE
jgi:hypothetical protein